MSPDIGDSALALPTDQVLAPLEARSSTPPRTRPPRAVNLRAVLIGLDGAAVTFGWTVALASGAGTSLWSLALAGPLAAVALGLIASQHLYLARVCGIRAVEVARLGRACALTGLLAAAAAGPLGLDLSIARAAGGAAASFGLLTVSRGAYRAWLREGRRRGRFARPVVIVGGNDEGLDIYHLIRDHPEMGFRVCGILGHPDFPESGYDLPWIDGDDDPVEAVRRQGATGVVIVSGALPSRDLNRLVREFLRSGIHVHLSSGLRGIAHRRLQTYPLAHEPLLYVENASLSRWQAGAKRAIDVMIAAAGLVISLPVLLAAATAIKLHDRGPVLIRQTRIGRFGKPFTMYKLRTMRPDAEQQLPELVGQNGRDGPLFKLAGDPRVTPVGRLLRATSIDELPQLVNVLQRRMSLVGPRPALPEEVAHFDEELRAREQPLPGITGLWQVEARDNPSFSVYRRLDLFYVENWSVSLDLGILLTTVEAVLARAIRALRRRGLAGEPSPVLD